ncbi:3454_t:CDS:2 [Scutellospora calospora]|uniref:3454_t:CDS:1 n=1 Tax=Scutellospora calospora TaxID=85575 RepID=A0ACA9KMP3_9GLOM|nr:3454_t:CDS:2 [Scutellospora calospora]
MSSLILSHKERAEGPWVKLQSEPSKATEVFVLDQQDNFDDLGEIYGLVFLFKMIGDVSGDVKGLHRDVKYEPIEELPKNVYFANQVVENSCATLAVLNIVLNCPRLEIGQELKEFKEFTWGLPPAAMDSVINSYNLIRHPEEALVVEEAATKKKGRGKKIVVDEAVGEAYHYIAYVPVDGEAWQLDGLYPHPVSLGKYSDEKTWYDATRGEINERINGFFIEEIEYVLLAITKDELGIHQDRINTTQYLLEEIDMEKKRKEVEKERRTFDYGPFFREFISILHERGELKSLLDAAEDMDERDEYV